MVVLEMAAAERLGLCSNYCCYIINPVATQIFFFEKAKEETQMFSSARHNRNRPIRGVF